MKKYLSFFLMLLLLFVLAVPVLAEEPEEETGVELSEESAPDDTFPSASESPSDSEPVSVPDDLAAPVPELDTAPEAPPMQVITPIESAGPEYEADAESADDGGNDKYPLGSYVDLAGNVFSPDGELLSPGTALALDPLPPDVPSEDAPGSPLLAEVPPEESAPPVYRVADLRDSSDSSGSPANGLKALVTSIFGEYEPIMTTAVVTETVGSETTTNLIDVVAGGSAGVDYEWIAGVVLFAILLYSFVRLLGGVLRS